SPTFTLILKTGALTIPWRSADVPVQSPVCLAFSIDVGSTEAQNASAQTAAVRAGQRKASLADGKMASAQGSSNGRPLALAPVINAAARIEAQKSRGD